MVSAHVRFEPTSTTCHVEPYAFHPQYATSSEHTRVSWAAHSYNVAFSDEIGHFEYCDGITDANLHVTCPSTGGDPSERLTLTITTVSAQRPRRVSRLADVSACSRQEAWEIWTSMACLTAIIGQGHYGTKSETAGCIPLRCALQARYFSQRPAMMAPIGTRPRTTIV